MIRVTSLDGRIYDFDDATLEKFEVPRDVVEKMKAAFDLPSPPAVPPPPVRTPAPVHIRRGPGNSIIIDVVPPA